MASAGSGRDSPEAESLDLSRPPAEQLPILVPANVDAALRLATAFLDQRSETPRLDAELLLADTLAYTRAGLLAELRSALGSDPWSRFRALLIRRSRDEPIAYLLGRAWFRELELLVTPDVLIPRPETEPLVDWSLEWLEQRLTEDPSARLNVIDLGTGSGAIALALALALRDSIRPRYPDSRIRLVASDVSPPALAVAEENSRRLGLEEQLEWVIADLFPDEPERYDLIVANLPYVGTDEQELVDLGVHRFEPHQALYAGADGLEVLRTLVALLPVRLCCGGGAALEIGYAQGAVLRALIQGAFPDAAVQIHPDLAGHDRIVTLERPPG